MLFGVTDACVFADVKTVDAVVLRVMRAAVVDAAAGDDLDIGIVPDEEIVIDLFLETAFCHHDGDMHGLVFGVGLDKNIQSADALLRDDIDVRAGLSADRLTVGADIVRACGNIGDVGDLPEQIQLYIIQLHIIYSLFPDNSPLRKACRSSRAAPFPCRPSV